MIKFENTRELWIFLLAGGTIKERFTQEKGIKMHKGVPVYLDGTSARNCLLSYDFWVGVTED